MGDDDHTTTRAQLGARADGFFSRAGIAGDFRRVAKTPKAVICDLIPQFILLPVGPWLATLALDLPANVEAAMILVAACPGGSLSNVVTYFGRGNTALSVSVSAVS